MTQIRWSHLCLRREGIFVDEDELALRRDLLPFVRQKAGLMEGGFAPLPWSSAR